MKFIIENAQIPTAQHMMMLFMLLMLVVSLFAAKKMAEMERQLEQLTNEMKGFPSQGVWIGEQEREQVWQWLSSKDGSACFERRFSTPPEGDDVAWGAAATSNIRNKQDLDQELAQIGLRVQEVQQKLNEMSQR